MRRWIAICLLLLAGLPLLAQSTRVRGRVTEEGTGEPIPFASVYFDGTTIGISTDLEGRYSLETRSREAKVLTASILGYESQSAKVTPGAFTEVNFSLKLDSKALNAALVKPDNRYIKSILRKLDQSRAKNDPDNAPDWETRVYSKIEIDVTNMEDFLSLGVMTRNLGFVQEYADTSAITGKPYIPALISENVSDMYHSQSPSYNREVIRVNHITGFPLDNGLQQYTGTYLLKTNFYKSSIEIFNLDIPNPAASSAHIFYNYFLVDSLQVQGRKTYVLRFHPKKLVTSPTIDGEFQIDAEDFGIRSIHARLAHEANVNWIRHINFDIENRRLDDGRWFYGEERLFIDFSISPSDNSPIISFLGNRHISYSEPVFKPVEEPDVLASDQPVLIRAGQEDVSPEYWRSVRPYPLTEREEGVFEMVDRFQQTAMYKWSYGIIRALTMRYVEVKPLKVEFGPWANSIAYSDAEGLRLAVGARTIKEFSRKLRLGGFLSYGLRDHDLKWEAETEFILRREVTRKLTLTAKKDYQQMSAGGGGLLSSNNIFSSILAPSHASMQTLVRYFRAYYEHEFSSNVNGVFKIENARYWGNPQVPFIRQDGTEQPFVDVNMLYGALRFSWDERVNHLIFVKQYMFTKYPVITIEGIAGIKGITTNDVGYGCVVANIDWKVPSNAIGFGRLHLEGGNYFGSVPYPMLKLHAGNETFLLDRDSFACMDYYEFASDRWVSGYYEHNFNGLVLGKIPLLKKLDLREIATVRCAWGTLSPANSGENAYFQLPMKTSSLEKTPYVEAGVGISNILRIFRVDAFWRLTNKTETSRNFSVNIGLDVAF